MKDLLLQVTNSCRKMTQLFKGCDDGLLSVQSKHVPSQIITALQREPRRTQNDVGRLVTDGW